VSFAFLSRTLVASVVSCLLIGNLTPSFLPTARASTTETSIALGSLRGLEGRQVDLKAPDAGLSVLIFYSSECPISNAYSPILDSLFGAFATRPVRWVGVCVDPDLSDADVKVHARTST